MLVKYTYNAWEKQTAYRRTGTAGLRLYTYNALKYRGYYYDSETGFYYLGSRYYDPVIGRFISADTSDVLTVSPTSLTDKNLYVYCDNNPVIRVDQDGEMWGLALTSGGTMFGSGLSMSAIGSSVVATLGTITPVGWAVIGTVAIIGVASVAIKYAKTKSETEVDTKDRVTSPIGKRKNYNSKKKAKEAAKKAGKGKEPIKHPKGYHGNKRPHYHPNVKAKYRVTPNGVSSHDHYYYPR